MADKGRGGYPSDVTDEEWALVLPYLLLCREDSPQRKYDLRTVFDAVRYVARTGGQWRFLPHDLPPWSWCISRCSAGSGRVVSSCWSRTCGRCCASGAGQEPTHGGRDRQPHPAIDAGIGSAGGL